MQDFEFTIQDGKLYMLQTRNGKRTGLAAVRVAIDMVREGLITQEEAIFRVEPNQLYDFLVPRLVEKGEKIEVLATGLPASPGAAVGQIVFTAEDAVKYHAQRRLQVHHPRPRRNHAGGHRRHGSRLRHSHLARRHDLARGCRHPRHGQVLRGRRRRLRRRRSQQGTPRQGPHLQAGRLDLARRHHRPRDRGQAQDAACAARRSRSGQVHELGRPGPPAARFAPTPTFRATPSRLACSAPKASAFAAPSTCSLPKTASSTCAP